MKYIYKVINLINGKTYIGQRTLPKKYSSPETDFYWGSGTLITRSLNKYGKENHKKIILLKGNFTQEEINRFEKCFIQLERLNNKAEYNLADGGNGGNLSSYINYKKVGQSMKKTRKEKYWVGGTNGGGPNNKGTTGKTWKVKDKSNLKGNQNAKGHIPKNKGDTSKREQLNLILEKYDISTPSKRKEVAKVLGISERTIRRRK